MAAYSICTVLLSWLVYGLFPFWTAFWIAVGLYLLLIVAAGISLMRSPYRADDIPEYTGENV